MKRKEKEPETKTEQTREVSLREGATNVQWEGGREEFILPPSLH